MAVSGLIAVALLGCELGATKPMPGLIRTRLASTRLVTNAPGRTSAAPATIALNHGWTVLASTRATLHAGDVILTQGDFELTNDIVSLGPPSGRRFDVTVSLRSILAATPHSVRGLSLTDPVSTLITWREHHFTFTPAGRFAVPRDLDGRTMYISVVAAATLHSPPARCRDPYADRRIACAVTVDRQLNQLGVLDIPRRTGTASPRTPAFAGASLPTPLLGQPDYGRRTVVWSSAPLTFRAGEIIDVSARLRLSATALSGGIQLPGSADTGCNAFFSGQLYLSPERHQLAGSSLPALSGDTGFNLTQRAPVAEWHELGFWQASRSDYGTRFVDLVAWASRSVACPAADVNVSPADSGVSVTLFFPGY